MRTLHALGFAAALALASSGAAAVDLSGDEASYLRERAQALKLERERNPSWDGGTRRVNEPQGEVKPDRPHGEVKARTSDGKRKRRPARDKVGRAVKSLPGALVRNR